MLQFRLTKRFPKFKPGCTIVRMKNCLLMVLFFSFALSMPLTAQAEDGFISSNKSPLHTRIENSVAEFVQRQTTALPGKVSYRVDEIDRRLVLSPCDELEAFLPSGSQLIAKTSVGVRCTKAGGWNILVSVQIKISLPVLVSARQLLPGHVLQEQDMSRLAIEATHMTYLTDTQQALGQVLRYGIGAGQILRPDMLRPPYSVTQGQVVQLIVRGGGFSVNNTGAALSNASAGQAVQVRVGASRVINGIARSRGVVEIEL